MRLLDLDRAAETRRFSDHDDSGLEEVLLDLMEVSADGEVIVTATGEDTERSQWHETSVRVPGHAHEDRASRIAMPRHHP